MLKDADPHLNLAFFKMLEHLRNCEKCRRQLPYYKFVRMLRKIYGPNK